MHLRDHYYCYHCKWDSKFQRSVLGISEFKVDGNNGQKCFSIEKEKNLREKMAYTEDKSYLE